MQFLDPIQILSLFINAIILYGYQRHYHSSLLSSKNITIYLFTVIFGILSVVYTLGLHLVFRSTGLTEDIFNIAFFYSAFTEEFVKSLIILLILWVNKVTDVLYDGIFYGIILGGIYGFIENILYVNSLPFWAMMLRTITSSPLHLLNGGIMGYFSMKFFFTEENYKYKFLMQGFFLCYITHAIYNFAGLMGDWFLIVLPLILIHNFILVEFLCVFARSSLPKFTLDLIDLSILEYQLIRRYTKYELWLYNSQKVENNKVSPFQKVTFRKKIFITLVLFISVGFIVIYLFYPELRKYLFQEILVYEYISIFIIYPFIIAVTILFAGLLNPDFFNKQVLQVPLISFLDANTKEYSETAVIFYLTLYGFYVSLENPEKFLGEVNLNFTIGKKEFNNIKGHAIWTNDYKGEIGNAKSPFSVSGALVLFDGYPFYLVLYWNWTRWTTRFRNLLKSIVSI
ncbi:MAG: PrsW family intramembrane metalloprotease [Leptospiraceae bacterium]|nr:PrsW family intramembrane metalloprotease [Leptospiraceae bacterium]